jgi:cardiolipin synthase
VVLARRRRPRLLWRRLRTLGATSDQNEVQVFEDGAAAFPAMLAAIDRAERRVWCETYILAGDRVGKSFCDALTRAAARGVEVRLLYDAVGSISFSRALVQPLVDAGGHARVFNPLLARGVLPLSMRDHRKILAVDDAVAFTGGMNLTEDYAAEPIGNGRFRDTHLAVRGRSAAQLAAVFQESWLEATRERLPAPVERPGEGEVRVQVLSSNTRRGRRQIQRAVRRAVANARARCWLTSPYFVPPQRLVRALRHAANRGVDVRVLTAGISDVPIVRRASRHMYGRLLKAGIHIHELYGQTLHAKTWLVDESYGQVGSFNLDRWSFRRNLEVSIGWFNEPLTRDLAAQFEADLGGAARCELEKWRRRGWRARLVDWLAYQVLRW